MNNNSLFFKRSLNTRGLNIIARLDFGLGLILSFAVVIYAIVKGHKFASQLPVTYRTHSTPQHMSWDFLNIMFPSQIPSPSYEFPAVTVCPEIGETAGIVSCFASRASNGAKIPCDETGTYSRVVSISGEDRKCMTVNDLPGSATSATSEGDVLTLTLSVRGAVSGSPSGVFVIAHAHKGPDVAPIMTFDNFFGAGSGTASEVISKKIYEIDQFGNSNLLYQVKPSSIKINDIGNATTVLGSISVLEFRYPKLEVTYEKSFLMLNMDSWIGEVGGLAFLLLMLQRGLIFAAKAFMNRSDKFSYMNLGKEYDQEALVF